MSLCKHCISGVRHEGTPEGKITTVNGVEVYIATPTVDYPKDKALLFLPDVFGIPLINCQLLADDFARNGFYTIIPDYFNGDPIPGDALNVPGVPADPSKNFDIRAWFGNHMTPSTRPPLDKVIAWLKEQGVTTFGAVGFCFGARYAFDLAFDDVIKVAVATHPSLLQIPEDLERYAKTNVPLLINSCTIDPQFPHEAQVKADEILGGGKFAPGYQREHWEGCEHGFSVRGDMSDPKVKAGKEGVFKASVEFLIKHL